MTNKITSTVKEAIGATKEKVGNVTHNEHLAASGAAQNAQGHAEKDAHAARTHAAGIDRGVHGSNQRVAGEPYDHSVGGPNQRVVGEPINDHTLGGANQRVVGEPINDPLLQGSTQRAAGGNAINNRPLGGDGHAANTVGGVERSL